MLRLQTAGNRIKIKKPAAKLMIKIIVVLICLGLSQAAAAQNKIYKCMVKGKTLYSESPCKENAYNENVFEVSNERLGIVAPSAETIDAANARIKRRSRQIDTENQKTLKAPISAARRKMCATRPRLKPTS